MKAVASRRLGCGGCLLAGVLGTPVGLGLVAACVLWSTDPASTAVRGAIEGGLNAWLVRVRDDAASGELRAVDRTVLHAGVIVGVTFTWPFYPEGSAVLRHAVYGDGADLELGSAYFSRSPHLAAQIERLGEGEHGPLFVRQSDDWRLSLAFNPYFLSVTETSVRLYHPDMRFAPVDGTPVYTDVPIGRMRLRVWDNLVSALGAEPFEAYAEWSR